MPNNKSAEKRMRNSEKKRQANKPVKSLTTSTGKRFLATVAEGDRAAAERACAEYSSVLDKAVKKGVLKANAASRRKSRATKKVAAMAG